MTRSAEAKFNTPNPKLKKDPNINTCISVKIIDPNTNDQPQFVKVFKALLEDLLSENSIEQAVKVKPILMNFLYKFMMDECIDLLSESAKTIGVYPYSRDGISYSYFLPRDIQLLYAIDQKNYFLLYEALSSCKRKESVTTALDLLCNEILYAINNITEMHLLPEKLINILENAPDKNIQPFKNTHQNWVMRLVNGENLINVTYSDLKIKIRVANSFRYFNTKNYFDANKSAQQKVDYFAYDMKTFTAVCENQGMRDTQEDCIDAQFVSGWDSFTNDDKKEIIKSTLQSLHERIIKQPDFGGTTFCGTFIYDNELITATAGDSSSLLLIIDNDYNIVTLEELNPFLHNISEIVDKKSSKNNNYTLLDEKRLLAERITYSEEAKKYALSELNRIKKCSEQSKMRIFKHNGAFYLNGLQCLKGLGDSAVPNKKHVSHEPDIYITNIKIPVGHRAFVITACDGLLHKKLTVDKLKNILQSDRCKVILSSDITNKSSTINLILHKISNHAGVINVDLKEDDVKAILDVYRTTPVLLNQPDENEFKTLLLKPNKSKNEIASIKSMLDLKVQNLYAIYLSQLLVKITLEKGSEDNVSVLVSEIIKGQKAKYLTVFDGHGNDQAAYYCSHHFNSTLKVQMKNVKCKNKLNSELQALCNDYEHPISDDKEKNPVYTSTMLFNLFDNFENAYCELQLAMHIIILSKNMNPITKYQLDYINQAIAIIEGHFENLSHATETIIQNIEAQKTSIEYNQFHFMFSSFLNFFDFRQMMIKHLYTLNDALKCKDVYQEDYFSAIQKDINTQYEALFACEKKDKNIANYMNLSLMRLITEFSDLYKSYQSKRISLNKNAIFANPAPVVVDQKDVKSVTATMKAIA